MMADEPMRADGGEGISCTLCEKRKIPKKNAETWCVICEEAFCESCASVHSVLKGSSNHKTISLEEYKQLPAFLSSIKLTCNTHSHPLSLFCPTHKEPLCCQCTTSKHKTCHGFEILENLLKDSASSKFLDLECAVDELSINMEKVYTNRKDALEALDDEVLEMATRIKRNRKLINEILDRNEKEVLHQLSTVHATYKEQIEELISNLQTKRGTINGVQKNIEELKKFASDYHKFFGARQLREKVEKEANDFRKLFDADNRLKQKNVNINFVPGNIVKNDHAFGILEISEKETEVPFTKNASLGGELSVDSLANIDAIKLRSDTQFKIESGFATRNLAGCTFLAKDRMVLADWSENKELIILDEKITDPKPIRVEKKTFDVVKVSDNCVAMTFPDARQVSVMDVETQQEKSNITFENRCWGVTATENMIFVREYSVGIHCLDMQCKIIKTLPVSGYITHITSFGGKIYYTEHTPDAVHCCDQDGTELWNLPLDGRGAPKGITVGQFGFVFVVLENEQKLLVISPHGKRHRELLSSENGLKEPHAISYDMERNKLLLVKDKTGLAELYDVIY